MKFKPQKQNIPSLDPRHPQRGTAIVSIKASASRNAASLLRGGLLLLQVIRARYVPRSRPPRLLLLLLLVMGPLVGRALEHDVLGADHFLDVAKLLERPAARRSVRVVDEAAGGGVAGRLQGRWLLGVAAVRLEHCLRVLI